jgi:alkylated DNA repair dioxygenase AlkB
VENEPVTGHDGQPSIDPQPTFDRLQLDDTSWADVSRGWMANSSVLFDHLRDTVPWQTTQLFRYEKSVEEKRLSSGWRRGRPLPHPVLAETTRAIQRRYKCEFEGFSMIQYRDNGDGQGFHRDTDMRWLDDTIIAVLTLGAQRPWLLRPRTARYSDQPHTSEATRTRFDTLDLAPASGDLLVMGGRCQADWEHSVPYLRSGPAVGVRISLQWRFARKVGQPFMGASFRSDVRYGQGKTATE